MIRFFLFQELDIASNYNIIHNIVEINSQKSHRMGVFVLSTIQLYPLKQFTKFLKKFTKKYPIGYLSIYEFSRQDLAPSHGAFLIFKNGRCPTSYRRIICFKGRWKTYHIFNYSIFCHKQL